MAPKSIRSRRFIGRVPELAVLEDARRSLSKSSGSFVLIAGEAGVGKTRLLHEFVERCGKGRERHVVTTECLEHAQQPMGPIRALMKSLSPKIDAASLTDAMRRALCQILPEFADDGRANEKPPLERGELFAELLELLGAVCAKRATILTVEDIHWADASTLAFLSFLAHRMSSMRLMTVATCRSEELGGGDALLSALAPLLREKTLIDVRLEPLAADDLRELVEAVLEGRDALPDGALLDIERRSEGNPFFAEELIAQYLSGTADGTLPRSIHASIAARLERLDRSERSVLQHAAALGQGFDPHLLAVAMGCSADDLLPALHHARELNFIVDGTPGRQTCRFRHALTRQAVYGDLPAFEAQRLHARVLSSIEASDDAAARLEELAFHAWQSGDRSKTFRYNEAAGEATYAMRALSESLDCFERARDAAATPAQRARMLERIGAIERLQGHYGPSIDAYERGLQINLAGEDYDAAARCATRLLGQRYNISDIEALPDARTFLDRYGERLSEEPRNALLVICARVAAALYDLPAASTFLDAIREPSLLAPESAQHYCIVRLMSEAYYGRASGWAQCASDATRVSKLLPPEAVVGLQSALALTGVFLGQNAKVERALAHARRVESEWGLRGPRVYNDAVAAAYCYQRGQLFEAVRRTETVAGNRDVEPASLLAAPVAARLAIALGDERVWRPFASRASAAPHNFHEPDAIFLTASHAALLAVHGEAAQAAAAIGRAAAALPHATPDAMYVLFDAARFGEASIQQHVRRLAEGAAESGEPVMVATAALVGALQSARAGDDAVKTRRAAVAAELYRTLEWPLLEAQALELGANTEEAAAIYERSGAAGELRRLRAASQTTPDDALAGLSSREHEVALLVARGLSNGEIARDLSIGAKTVEKHLSSVFGKLGLRSRSQVAALVAASRRP